jgi:hypothetical protein
MEGVPNDRASRLSKGDRWLARMVALATLAGVLVALWQGVTANQRAIEANETATEARDASIRPLLVGERDDRRVRTAAQASGDCRSGGVCLAVPLRNIGPGPARVQGAWMNVGGSVRRAPLPPLYVASREQATFMFPLKRTEVGGGRSQLMESPVTVEVEYTDVALRQTQRTILRLLEFGLQDVELK